MSSSNTPSSSRRSFLVRLATALPVGMLVLRVNPSAAQAATAPEKGSAKHVSPSEPLAQSLGYVDDASAVNKTKFPTYKPGQKCSGCRFFQGTAGQATGPCQIFSGELVNAEGWCTSFSPKT